MKKKSIAYAVLARNIKEKSPISDFLENAQRYGHQIDHLIIVYNDYIDRHILEYFENYCPVEAIQLDNKFFIHHCLLEMGLAEQDIDALISTPNIAQFDLVSYGTARNYALIAALYYQHDYLFFFDSDIYPKILTKFDSSGFEFCEIDFIGEHLKHLQSENVVVTTSDYTGYYIIPKMNFPYLRDLLRGVQKEDRFYYISTVETPVASQDWGINIYDTRKALGGNLALDLNELDHLPPFYSTTLKLNGQCYLGRGEDTLFGPLIYENGGRCVDIDLLIFHNCFGDFPDKPDISIAKNVDRFFFACIGWIIRNPFFNWLQSKYGYATEEINRQNRHLALQRGSEAAAEYFGDERFLCLPAAFTAAYDNLPAEIERFNDLLAAWHKFKIKLKERK